MHKHEMVQGNLACIAFAVMVLKMNSGQSLGHPVYKICQLCFVNAIISYNNVYECIRVMICSIINIIG